MHTFAFQGGADRVLEEGVIRSRSFPGLWIDVAGLIERGHQRMLGTLEAGLATPEHAEFVERLAARKSA